ncbi:hypothetical protein GGS21DRAFT_520941 [Xylaria nigripes]|nr:hypothetical protein GGS21DRAFT_520941 [Xylaria nigripes]
MADASCSSSNAFKGLARHIEQDRSHQQDRVAVAPQHAAQSFRSQRFGPGVSHEFNAFQQQGAVLPPPSTASLEPPSAFQYHPSRAPAFAPFQPPHQSAGFAPTVRSDWINEFQRMDLSAAHHTPIHTHQGPSPIIGQPSFTNAMHYDAFPQQSNFQNFQPFQSPSVNHFPMDPSFTTYDAGAHGQMPHFIEDESALKAQADLDQAFEDAMNEWMLENGPAAETQHAGDLNAQSNENLTASLDAASAEPTTQEAAKEDSLQSKQNDTELARVAQQLVDCLADNESEKFKNSEFLAVMRRIASLQLTIQGNNLVETPQPPAVTETTSGSHVTGTTSATPDGPISPNQNQQNSTHQAGTSTTSA